MQHIAQQHGKDVESCQKVSASYLVWQPAVKQLPGGLELPGSHTSCACAWLFIRCINPEPGRIKQARMCPEISRELTSSAAACPANATCQKHPLSGASRPQSEGHLQCCTLHSQGPVSEVVEKTVLDKAINPNP